jgi:hypothetical protein
MKAKLVHKEEKDLKIWEIISEEEIQRFEISPNDILTVTRGPMKIVFHGHLETYCKTHGEGRDSFFDILYEILETIRET